MHQMYALFPIACLSNASALDVQSKIFRLVSAICMLYRAQKRNIMQMETCNHSTDGITFMSESSDFLGWMTLLKLTGYYDSLHVQLAHSVVKVFASMHW